MSLWKLRAKLSGHYNTVVCTLCVSGWQSNKSWRWSYKDPGWRQLHIWELTWLAGTRVDRIFIGSHPSDLAPGHNCWIVQLSVQWLQHLSRAPHQWVSLWVWGWDLSLSPTHGLSIISANTTSAPSLELVPSSQTAHSSQSAWRNVGMTGLHKLSAGDISYFTAVLIVGTIETISPHHAIRGGL